MPKLIYIRTSYQHGIVLPISAISLIPEMKVIKNAGYAELKDLTTDTEYGTNFSVIDSLDIDRTAREQRYIDDLVEDLAKNQKALDYAFNARMK